MAGGRGPHDDGKAPRKPPGLLGRLLLALSRPLPAAVSLQSLVKSTMAAASVCTKALEAVLLITSPLAIGYLTWLCLGAAAAPAAHIVW